jgi:hypothetical protein
MSSARKGFFKLPALYRDFNLERDQIILLWHLILRQAYKPGTVEFQPGQAIQVGKNSCLISYRELEEITRIPRSTIFDQLGKLRAKGLIRITTIQRACMVIRLMRPDEIDVARVVSGQIDDTQPVKSKAKLRKTLRSVRTANGQQSGQQKSDKNSQKEGNSVIDAIGRPDRVPDTRCLTTRIKTLEFGNDAVFVDNSTKRVDNYITMQNHRLFNNAPLRQPYSRFGGTDGALALSPEEGGENLSWGVLDTLEASKQSASDKRYPDHLCQLKIPPGIPIEKGIKAPRFPTRDDFASRAEWIRAQYQPQRRVGEYFDSLQPARSYAFKLREGSAKAKLLAKNWSYFQLADAIRDVQRNGMIGTCDWEQPPQGIINYLIDHGAEVLARIERQDAERARRIQKRAEWSMLRESQRFDIRVRAFKDAFVERPRRRQVIDDLRKRYPVIFREIPRGGMGELAVAAHLWSPKLTSKAVSS